jgi:hypothetical protein
MDRSVHLISGRGGASATLRSFMGALTALLLLPGCSHSGSRRSYQTTTAGTEVPPSQGQYGAPPGSYDQGAGLHTTPGAEPGAMKDQQQLQQDEPHGETMPGNEADQELYQGTQPRTSPSPQGTEPGSPGSLQLTPPSVTPSPGGMPQGHPGGATLTPPGASQGPSGQYAPGQPSGASRAPGTEAQPGAMGPGGEALHAEVHDALTRAPNLDSAAIDIAIRGEDVYLSGYVPTPEQRRLAHDVAHSVEGVQQVYTRDLQVR